MDDFLGIPQLVGDAIALVQEVVEISDDGAEVLAGRDGTPSTDRVEANGDGLVGQQRRRLVGFHLVGMIDPQHHERRTIVGSFAVISRACSCRELVGAQNVLRTEVARPQTVHTREESRHLIRRYCGKSLGRRMRSGCHRLV